MNSNYETLNRYLVQTSQRRSFPVSTGCPAPEVTPAPIQAETGRHGARPVSGKALTTAWRHLVVHCVWCLGSRKPAWGWRGLSTTIGFVGVVKLCPDLQREEVMPSWDFPCGSDCKESSCNVRDPGFLGREDSLEKGMATHSCLEISMDKGA